MGAEIGLERATDKPTTSNCACAYFSPLGVTLRVTASHPRLIEAVAAVCRGWEAPADLQGPTLRLSLKVGPVAVDGAGPVIESDGPRLSVRGDVEAHADAGYGEAWCRVGSADAFDDPAFREQVLDSLILWLLTRNGRTPIHASGFVVGSTAILLAGRSGSGKSCLALAAHAARFPLLSDDTVYLETESRFRVWGIPRPIHLLPEDAPQSPRAPTRFRNGKHKRAIALPAPSQPVEADAATLCVLRRGDQAALEWLDSSTALATLGPPEPGFDLLAREIEAGLRRITPHGAWRLTLSAEPKEAIALLGANLPRLMERATS
jgi:hypothetical protein